MDESGHRRYRFADILVDEDQRVIWVDGEEVDVEPRVFDTLIFLIRHRDHAVSKQELEEAVWPRMIVSDTVLSRAIMKARKAVGDNAKDQGVIRTLHGHGYRFIADVEECHQDFDPSFSATETQDHGTSLRPPRSLLRFNRRWVPLLAALLAAISLMFSLRPDHATEPVLNPPVDGVSVAVLPFKNLSDDVGNEFFSDGLSEEIMNRLAGVEGLFVVARTSAFSFKDSQVNAQTIARELKVSHLIDGSVQRSGNRLRVVAQLTDGKGFQLWSKTFTSELGDVFTLQDSIANDIVSQVLPTLPAVEASRVIDTEPPTRNLEAYDRYLMGNWYLERRIEASLRRSIELFEQAIELDSSYGDAYVGLATAYVLLPGYSYELQEEAFGLAMQTIALGEAADPSVATKASAIRSLMLFESDWRWDETERGFRRAIDHEPDSSEALMWYSMFLASTGKLEESLEVAQSAQRLDPLSPVINHRLAVAHLWADNDREAETFFERARELGMPMAALPGPYLVHLVRSGEIEEAKRAMAARSQALGLPAGWMDPLYGALEDSEVVDEAVQAVLEAESSGFIPRRYRTGIWTYLREYDRAMDAAFDMLDDPSEFFTEFLFIRETSALRSHPRFPELMRALGLLSYWEMHGWPSQCRPEGSFFVCD